MALSKAIKQGSSVVDMFSNQTIEASSQKGKKIPMKLNDKAMAKIMGLLTDMYEEPVKAAVRETISNALDATSVLRREGRNPAPVEITSPSYLNPYFVVKDSGIGMSPYDIEHCFSEYGASTKEEAFDETGSLGLGAKSPLAITDEYFFETTRDGVTSEVVVSRDISGPSTEILNISETGKPSGTTVRIPVDNYTDVISSKFQESIQIYRDYAFTMGQSIIVDGVEQKENEKYILLDEFTTEVEDSITGKVWLNTAALREINSELGNKDFSVNRRGLYQNFSLVISGFVYDNPENYYGLSQESLFLVELNPGILNFAPSRDYFIQDDRFFALEALVNKQLFEQDALFKGSSLYCKTLKDSEAYLFISRMEPVVVDDETVKFEYPTDPYDSSLPDSVNMKISDWTTHSGSNFIYDDQRYKHSSPLLGYIQASSSCASDLYREYFDNSTNHDLKWNDIRRNGKKLISLEKRNIGKIRERFIHNFHYTNSGVVNVTSLVDPKIFYKDANIAVVAVESEKELNAALRSRGSLQPYEHLIFVKGMPSEELKRVIRSRIATKDEQNLVFVDNSQLKKIVAENRASSNSGNVDKNTVSLFKKDSVLKSFDDIMNFSIKNADQGYQTLESLLQRFSVDELISENALIIVKQKNREPNYKNILNGLYYSEGNSIFERPIYVVKDPKKSFYDAFAKNKNLVVFDEGRYKARSKIEGEFFSERTFSRPVSKDILESIPTKIQEKMYLAYLISRNSYDNKLIAKYFEGSAYLSLMHSAEKWQNKNSSVQIQKIIEHVKSISDVDISSIESKINMFNVLDMKEKISQKNLRYLNICAILLKEAAGVYVPYSENKNIREITLIFEVIKNTSSESFKEDLVNRIDSIIEQEVNLNEYV